MNQQDVAAAIAEARRFIDAAERWQKRAAGDRMTLICGTREGGAMRRASLDLSAALSQMRRPAYRRGGGARALADLATAAAEHEQRVRADERAMALREAADVCEREATDCSTATGSYIAGRCEAKLRAMADEAERVAR